MMMQLHLLVHKPEFQEGDTVQIDCDGSRGPWEFYDKQVATVIEVTGRVFATINSQGSEMSNTRVNWEYVLRMSDGTIKHYDTVLVKLRIVPTASQ